MLKKLLNECKFTLQIKTEGPLLVKSGSATPHGPDMTPVLTYKDGKEQVFIPGSSLKGVFRSHIEKVIRTLNEQVVCLPYEKIECKIQGSKPVISNYNQVSCGEKFELRKKKDQGDKTIDCKNGKLKLLNPDLTSDSLSNAVVYCDSCPACRLFGSTYFIGRIAINDAYLLNPVKVELYTEPRDGVAIDRFSGGAVSVKGRGSLFNLLVISAAVTFETEIYLRNFEIWQLGALMLIIQDMEDKLIYIGSGRSRGLGKVSGTISGSLNIQYLLPVIGEKKKEEVWGLGKLMENDTSYGTFSDDILTLQQLPVEENVGIRRIQRFENDSLSELKSKATNQFVKKIQGWSVPERMKFDYLNLREANE